MSSILTGSTTSSGTEASAPAGAPGRASNGAWRIVEVQMAVPEVTRTIRILLFGSLGEALGRELATDIPARGCSIGELRSALLRLNVGFEALDPARAKACVNHVLVGDEHPLRGDEEVAFLPPLSGG